MLLKFFNSNRIGVLIFILLLPVVYWIPDFDKSTPLHGSIYSGTLTGLMIQNFNRDFRISAQLIALLVILINAYLLVLLNRIHIFIPGRTQLPALFYILLTACFNPVHYLTASLLASFLLIFVLYRLIITYKTDGISFNFLDAGFLIALASLIYFQAILFFLLLLTGMILLRPFIWREWVYAFIGLGLPYLFLFSGYFLAGVPVSEYFPGLTELFVRNKQTFTLIQWIGWAFIFTMILYGSYFMITTIDNMKIQGRKNFLVFLWFFLFSGGIYAAVPGTGIEMICFAAIPLAFLFSHYFYKCNRNWINEILFTLFLLFIVALRIL